MRREIPASRLRQLPEGRLGLTTAEVADRKIRFGTNHILEVARNPWRDLARETFKDPMIWFLVGTGFVYAGLGNTTEALTLLVAILPLVGMDAFLHRRSQASTEGLSRQLAQTAHVVRDGAVTEIPAIDLVPGDLVNVSMGEPFPADGLIIQGESLQSDEASLTGEAYPVPKQPMTAPPKPLSARDSAWIEGEHWGLAGTRLLTGQAQVRVVFTGGQTLYGEIVHAAVSGDPDRTPLQKAIANLVTLLVIIAAILCVVLAAVRLHQGHDWIDALVSAATLAVAALPEEFPVVFTVFLGVGVYRLARQRVLVRRSVSVENIGRITCVCSDKTGTITEGRLRLEHLIPAEGLSDRELLLWAGLASRGETGDPMDMAILARLAEHPDGHTPETVLATFPYTEQRRRETAVIQMDGHILAVTKGAPEVLLALTGLEATERRLWTEQVDRLAAAGHKVLTCLYWDLGSHWTGGEPDRDGRFAGLLAFEDPIREGVIEAVRECREAGIRVIMVTGDHPATAVSVAQAIGLMDESAEGLILGEDLADAGQPTTWSEVAVIARALPAHKLDLVRALKTQGEIVAVTGDGVNDVPALQAADVGIAMGGRATRSAREVAAIVLLNDNFSTLIRAIAEGRQLFRNLQVSFQYILMMHIPLVITAIFIPLAGYPILYLPIHIVWYETLIHPTALLVFQELPACGPLQRVPERQATRFFSRTEWGLIALIGGLLTALILWAYDRSLLPGGNVEHARAMVMVVLSCASATATAVLSRLRTKSAWLMTILTLAASLILVQTPWLAAHLNLQPLHGVDWLIAFSGGLLAVAGPLLLSQAAERMTLTFRNKRSGKTKRTPNVTASRGETTTNRASSSSLTRYAWLSIGAALATIILKTTAYWITDSVALLSDAAESLVNLIGAIFALISLQIAARPADESHPFGHGKAEYFSSGFEGALILVAALGIAWTAWDRFLYPHPLGALDLGLGVSGIATVINLITARVLLKAGHRFGSITLEADGRHLMTDVWTTGAVLLGLGGVIVTGWQWLDSAVAGLAALNIVASGVHLIQRSLSGLLGAAIPPEERQRLDQILERYRQAGYEFHDIRARMAGIQRFITFHLLVPGVMTIKDAHDLSERLEAEIHSALPNLLIVTHVEPLEDAASFSHEMISPA